MVIRDCPFSKLNLFMRAHQGFSFITPSPIGNIIRDSLHALTLGRNDNVTNFILVYLFQVFFPVRLISIRVTFHALTLGRNDILSGRVANCIICFKHKIKKYSTAKCHIFQYNIKY